MNICQIDWPPDAAADKASEACLLIRTKDFLNTLAKPASGATIAFTILVTQGDRKSVDTQVCDDTPSRMSLASAAYPDLLSKARRFRRLVLWLSLFLFGWLMLTCGLSWWVAYGNTAITQLSTAQANYTKAQQVVEGTEVLASSASGQSPAGPAVKPNSLDGAVPADQLCLDAARQSAANATVHAYASTAQLHACEALQQASFERLAARTAMATWLSPFDGQAYLNNRSDADILASANAPASTYGNGILPFCFGLLGAGAAIVRSLSRKMKFSLLAPRDLNLSLQQLALGAVTGACIGLFVALPGSNPAPGTTLGAVALSGSALSFIAGFGVDAVFTTIEGIIQRIFNIPASPGSPAANDPQK